MKNGVVHEVPLSAPACDILRLMKRPSADADDYIFCNRSGAALSNMSMLMLLRRMGYERITVHGFRSTFRDWAGDLTEFQRETIEMSLAHTISSATERAYRRGRAFPKAPGTYERVGGILRLAIDRSAQKVATISMARSVTEISKCSLECRESAPIVAVKRPD